MFTFKSLIALTLVGGAAALTLTGCATTGTADITCEPKAERVVLAPPAPKVEVQEKIIYRDREVIKEVPGPARTTYSTVTVIQEVPGPERVVVKEVPVEKEVTKKSK